MTWAKIPDLSSDRNMLHMLVHNGVPGTEVHIQALGGCRSVGDTSPVLVLHGDRSNDQRETIRDPFLITWTRSGYVFALRAL